MMKTNAGAAVALSMMVLSCGAQDQDRQVTGNGQFISTRVGNMLDLLDGYRFGVDEAASRCIEPTVPVEFDLADTRSESTSSVITSATELAKKLNIRAGAPVGPGAAPVGLSIHRKYSSSRYSAAVLFKGSYSYLIKASLRSVLAQGGDAHDFIGRCGTHYVDGLYLKASYYVLVGLKTNDASLSRELALMVNGNSNNPAALQAAVDKKKKSSHADFSTEVVAEGSGFMFDNTDSAGISGTDILSFLSQAGEQHIRQVAVLDAVVRAYWEDAYRTDQRIFADAKAQGFSHPLRTGNAMQVERISVRPYMEIVSDPDLRDQLGLAAFKAERSADNMEGWYSFEKRLEAATHALDATQGPEWYLYQFSPRVGSLLTSRAQQKLVADTWYSKLAPCRKQVRDSILSCAYHLRTLSDVYPCQAFDQNTCYQTLANYEQQAQLERLPARLLHDSAEFEHACNQAGYRLPNTQEASRMALLAEAAGTPFWVDDTGATCGAKQKMVMTNAGTYSCQPTKTVLRGVCME